jgi:F-type H+-transporting ATPase subunit delta
MAEAISVARPYALAAFDEATKLGNLKGWSETLLSAADAVANAEVHALISSPRVTKKQLEDLILALCGDKLSMTERNFIKLLVENQRLILLPEIAAMFETMRAEAEKSIDVVVTSAFELNEPQKQKISAAMKKRMGREIRLSCNTDRELLGGIIIRAGDKVIDGSARTRLTELANALA